MENRQPLATRRMDETVFSQLSRLIGEQIGIKMPPSKRVMLESRLQKRLRVLGLADFGEYWDYLVDGEGRSAELIELIDVVTTNKTDFFRENDHFTYTAEEILPSFWDRGIGRKRPVRFWSAACSTGEEPYTMAMVLEDFAREHPGFQYLIHASDISEGVLKTAVRGIYPAEKAAALPREIKKRYMLRSRDRERAQIKMKPVLSRNLTFYRMNLKNDAMEKKNWYDVIFCRNVLIYFVRERQEEIIRKLTETLRPGGYLFLGHSESTTGMTLPLRSLKSSVYQKLEGEATA